MEELPVNKEHHHLPIYHPEYLQLIFPFLSTLSTLICIAINFLSPVKQVQTPPGLYAFYHRIPLWIMQVLLIVLRILLAFSMKDLYVWDILLPISILLAVVLDGGNIATSTLKVRCWLSLYVIVLLYTIKELILDPNNIKKIAAVICALLVITCSTLRSLFSFSELHQNPPTEEYTCNLLSYITFSYLNATLITTKFQER